MATIRDVKRYHDIAILIAEEAANVIRSGSEKRQNESTSASITDEKVNCK